MEAFTGQELDGELGLYNFRARDYDPALKIFYASDPASEDFSPYMYVGGNPVMLIDPTGMDDALPDWPGITLPGVTVYADPTTQTPPSFLDLANQIGVSDWQYLMQNSSAFRAWVSRGNTDIPKQPIIFMSRDFAQPHSFPYFDPRLLDDVSAVNPMGLPIYGLPTIPTIVASVHIDPQVWVLGSGPNKNLGLDAGETTLSIISASVYNEAVTLGKNLRYYKTGPIGNAVRMSETAAQELVKPIGKVIHGANVIQGVATIMDDKLTWGLKGLKLSSLYVSSALATPLVGIGISVATDYAISSELSARQYSRTHFVVGSGSTSVSIPKPGER